MSIYSQLPCPEGGQLLHFGTYGKQSRSNLAIEASQALDLGYQIYDDLRDRQIDSFRKADASIVNALSREGTPSETTARALDMAESELTHSSRLAGALPSHSGAPLRSMADELIRGFRAYRG